MGWRDNLRDASFGGVPFKVLKSDTESGRRVQEVPRFQKRTVTVDLGPELTKFQLEAYVIQNPGNDYDYFGERDALIKQLNKRFDRKNPPKLIHPFYGELKCHAEKYTVTESFNEGGIAKFKITFMLEEEEIFPGDAKDYNADVGAAVTGASNNASDNFISAFNTAGSFIDSVGNDIIKMLDLITTGIASVNGAFKSTVSTALGIVSTAISQITSVLNAPCDLFDTMKTAADSFKELVGMGSEVVQGGVAGGCSGTVRGNVVTLDGETVPEKLGISTVEQIIAASQISEDILGGITNTQKNNRYLSIDMMIMLLIMVASEIVMRVDFSSRNELYRILKLIMARIDELLLQMGERTDIDYSLQFEGLEELRAILANSMIEKGLELKRIIDYVVPGDVISTLQVAYDKYEDLDREQEIIDRNDIIQHPGFVPSGETIQILES